MPYVATLIAKPAECALTPALVDMAAKHVKAKRVDWLQDAVACDIYVHDDPTPAEIEALVREAISGAPIDIIVQPTENRRKRILLADMDSTMIDQECIDELADEVGVKERVAAITARAMNGEVAFEPALRERVALLAGVSTDVVERIVAQRITLASGAKPLIATMRAHGSHTALISGGFTAFTQRVAALLGFDESRANVLVEDNDRFVGRVAEPILGREAKASALAEIAARLGVGLADVIAVGDGANDLDMLKSAGSGIALHAKPAVAAAAPLRIDHGDLTALLYIQGYRKAEFRT